MSITVHEHWEQIVTVALLGTDRRDPPDEVGPVADLVADAMRPSPAERFLAEVAAVTAVRRAGFMALDPVDPLATPASDDRPVCSRAAVDRWRHVVASWAVLEDEWMLTLIENGWRTDPELVPAMLSRHRRDPIRWTRAVVASGPLAAWLVEQLPSLDLSYGRSFPKLSPNTSPADAFRTNFGKEGESIGELPVLPIPPELGILIDAPGADVGATLRAGMADGSLGTSHRLVLANLIARVRPDALVEIASELSAIEPVSGPHELAAGLADLARTRWSMLAELTPRAAAHDVEADSAGRTVDDR